MGVVFQVHDENCNVVILGPIYRVPAMGGRIGGPPVPTITVATPCSCNGGFMRWDVARGTFTPVERIVKEEYEVFTN